MKIITVPHQTLRQTATAITNVDAKLQQFSDQLAQTLAATRDPKGIGLAAPQVDKTWRLFVTQFDDQDLSQTNWDQVFRRKAPAQQLFINPVIVDHSTDQELGPNDDEYLLEGCLSIPKIYGPAPRWQWIEITYQNIENGELVDHSLRLEDFSARVVQHEIDHLNGILFTDYVLQYDLPAYTDDPDTGKVVKLKERAILETF